MRLMSKRCTFIRLLSTGTIIHIIFIAGCGNAALIVPQNYCQFKALQVHHYRTSPPTWVFALQGISQPNGKK
ncbi:hypothetical protein DL95DRAFT_393186 [Leptodontidium sp. 2 PMI_412]|nr:hypothetical protein DL95DRAFT_393186 [Leptodontidium sp. 2 PMI_412]